MKRSILLTSALVILTGCGNVGDTKVKIKPEPSVVTNLKINAAFVSDVEAKMQAHNLNGFSLAIIDDYKITYSQQWGVKSADSGALIDGQTAFSSASTSKAITALLCIMLEEKGFIDLDAPISKYLTRWSLPGSEFTNDTQVTWKHLLSHMAGTTQPGFADFYAGDDIPTLVDSLQGKLPRYNNEPINFIFKPGTDWAYSGGGYTIIQMALEDHFKKPLRVLAAENIFIPLGMKNTTMMQPNETGFLTNVASVHDRNGDVIRSGLPITPQVSASGMWSTPSDLAKLAVAMQKALRGDKTGVVSPKTARTATDIISLKKSGGNALGWMRGFGFGNTDWFRHDGSNTGVGNELMASMEGGYGLVFFANGEKPNRFPVSAYVRNEVLRMMGWETTVRGGEVAPDMLIQAIKGPYRDFLYGVGMDSKIITQDNKTYLTSPVFEHFLGKDRSEMVYLGDNTFKILDYPNQIQFNLDAQSQVKNLTMFRDEDPNLSIDVEIEK